MRAKDKHKINQSCTNERKKKKEGAIEFEVQKTNPLWIYTSTLPNKEKNISPLKESMGK